MNIFLKSSIEEQDDKKMVLYFILEENVALN